MTGRPGWLLVLALVLMPPLAVLYGLAVAVVLLTDRL